MRVAFSRFVVLLAIVLMPDAAFGDDDFQRMVSHFPGRAGLSVAVADANSRETILDYQSATMRSPASVLKLLTSYSALKHLGSGYTFETQFLVERRPPSSSAGSLCVRAGGDPSLVTEKLPLIAFELRRRGVQALGDIQIDSIGAAFEPRQGLNPYQAARGAVVFNHNSLEVSVAPTRVGEPTLVTTPFPSPIEIENRSRTVAGKRATISVQETPAGRLTVSGEIGVEHDPHSEYVAVPDPARFLGMALQEVLRQSGVNVRGALKHTQCGEGMATLFAFPSDPLRQIVRGLNQFSNNLLAHQVGLALGKSQTGRLELEAGLRVMEADLQEMLPSSEPARLYDASGLRHENRVSARQLLAVLLAAWGDISIQSDFLASLARYGERGTLKTRMTKIPTGAAVWAKTGTIDGVSALAGYLHTTTGKRLAFVILNNSAVPKTEAANFEDEVVASLIDAR